MQRGPRARCKPGVNQLQSGAECSVAADFVALEAVGAAAGAAGQPWSLTWTPRAEQASQVEYHQYLTSI